MDPVTEEDRLSAALGELPSPQHLCSISEKPEERDAAATSFLRIGIERGEKCLFIAGRDSAYQPPPGVEVLAWDKVYLPGGAFDPETMWAWWARSAREAREQGYSGLRCAAEADWVAHGAPGTARWSEYESRLTDLAAQAGCSILCQYSRALFPAWIVSDAIRTHPGVIYRHAVCGNLHYEPAAEFLDRDRLAREVDRLLGQIHSRALVDEALRQANTRSAEILESTTDAFTAFDRDWRILSLNERAVQLLGKPRDALIGRRVWEVFPEGVGSEHYHKFQQAMRERVPLVFDGYSPGRNRWYANHVYPTREGLACYWSDVTDARRDREELRRSVAYLAEGERISHTGSWAWNVASGDIFWSAEHFRICGLDPATFTPTIETAPRIIHPEDLPAAREAWENATAAKHDFDCEFRVLRPDGVTRRVRSLGHPVFGPAGELIEYVGTIMDITEQRESQDRLNQLQDELVRVSRTTTLGELAASIAHELNQPLAAIATDANAGESWLAHAPPDIAEASESLHRIARDATRAGEVITRIRALLARRPTQRVALQIEDVLRDACLLVQKEAEAKRVQLHLSRAQEPLPSVVGDRVQLQQVLLNLMVNAFEAMSGVDGLRKLELRAEPFDDNALVISVSDSGGGVGADIKERIFDAFFTTKGDGMGMGLAISRSIVEAHGGRLWAYDNDGPGARFCFTLPVLRDM